LNHFPLRNSRLAVLGEDADLLGFGMTGERLVDDAAIFLRFPGNHCKVFFFYFTLHELAGQLALRLARASQEQHAACEFVDAMDDASARKLIQDAIRLGPSGNRGQAGGFVNCEDIVVLPKNFEHRFGILRERSREMNYRRLGAAGVKLSEIGLGGWLTFANAVEEEQAKAILDRAFDLGINFFDTANVYAVGGCEEAWGRLLSKRKRSDIVLATKVFFPMGRGPNDSGLSRKHIYEQCHASLKRLHTDYIDLYQCHRFDENTPLEETIRAIDDLIRAGKVLYWGFSEWSAPQIEQCLRLCGDRFDKPRSSQPRYSAIERYAEAEVFPLCHKAGIGQVVFSPLAQGVLTGKYKPGAEFPADSRAADDRQNQFIKRFTSNDELLKKVQRLIPIAQERKLTMSQMGLAWVLRRKEVTSCIIGASKVSQLDENVVASGLKLPEETVRRIDEILA
jgi:aryl-alcohol dehydrogenase-like predicted oxidoreductase